MRYVYCFETPGRARAAAHFGDGRATKNWAVFEFETKEAAERAIKFIRKYGGQIAEAPEPKKNDGIGIIEQTTWREAGIEYQLYGPRRKDDEPQRGPWKDRSWEKGAR